MPAEYHVVPPGIWTPQMRLLSKEACLLANYVYSCRDRRTEGLFELSAGRAAADTPLTHAEAEAAFIELDSVGLISYDTENEIVLDRHALRRMPLRHGRNKETGEIRFNKAMPRAVQHFRSLVDCPLKEEFVSLAATHSPDLLDALIEAGVVEFTLNKGGWGGGEKSQRQRQSPIREETELSTEKETELEVWKCRGCSALTEGAWRGEALCDLCLKRDEKWARS